MQVDTALRINDSDRERAYSPHSLIDALDGARIPPRTTQTVSYQTPNLAPLAIYYTALAADGATVLVARDTFGITLLPCRLYAYTQDLTLLPDGATQWIAVWDEGDPAAYTLEWVTVDT